ncbi:MAG: 4Fe-4S binding protein [Oscillospiraceae bacterium]|nr:4Fe-4S binding protein [Oscillospiraceae bacterium]
MNRPSTVRYQYPKALSEIPLPIAQAGVLIDINSGFRTSRPVFDHEKCVGCMSCYAVCPEGTIYRGESGLQVDYDFCKGCGICAKECRFKAISMVPEEGENE